MGLGAFSVLVLLRLLLCPLLVVLVLSCPGAEKRDPPYPPLVDSPSLPTPCEDQEDGYTTRGGRWGFLFRPLGFVIANPYFCGGLALFLFWFCKIGGSSPFLAGCFVVVALMFELRFLYSLLSSCVARPLVFPEGVRVVLGHLPCPWSRLCFCLCFVCLL